MITFTQSDIFQMYDKNHAISQRINNLLTGNVNAVILNEKLKTDLDILLKTHKEVIVMKAINSVRSGEMVLLKLGLDSNLPEFLPFIKAKKAGKELIYINLSKYVTERKDSDSGEIEYKIDNRKLYAIIICAYIYLKELSSSTVLSPAAIQISSLIWARMFNKVLIKTLGITSNRDRYDAFMYFAIKFFITYYLEGTGTVVNNITDEYLKHKGSPLINYMEEKIKDLNLTPYKSFKDFCYMLFNNEVSNIKGIRINNIQEKINISFYLEKFINMYGMSAILSLAAYPYFLFIIISSYNMSGISNDRAMEDIVAYDKKEIPKLLNSIYKEIN